MRIGQQTGESSRNWPKSAKFQADDASDGYEIHSEARGPHWIAWVSRDGDTKPDRSVVLVGANTGRSRSRAPASGPKLERRTSQRMTQA